MKGLVVQVCLCEIILINSLSIGSVNLTRVLLPVSRVRTCVLVRTRV